MVIYMIGKPKTREELEKIFMHDEIIFIDSIEEYRQHKLNGIKPTLMIVDDVEPPKPIIHVGHIGHISPGRYGKSIVAELLAEVARLDFAALEARVLAGMPDMVIDDHIYDIKTLSEPVAIKSDGRERRSKGEKRRNRRHRWSGQ